MLITETPMTEWIRLVRAEYDEMPGLVLTCPQVRRMWGVDETVCHTVLTELVRSGFLARRPNGSYGRPTDLRVARAS